MYHSCDMKIQGMGGKEEKMKGRELTLAEREKKAA